LPIVFLTSESEREGAHRHRARAGAATSAKPVKNEVLIANVAAARLEQVRFLRRCSTAMG
jgi:hypothetical protein